MVYALRSIVVAVVLVAVVALWGSKGAAGEEKASRLQQLQILREKIQQLDEIVKAEEKNRVAATMEGVAKMEEALKEKAAAIEKGSTPLAIACQFDYFSAYTEMLHKIIQCDRVVLQCNAKAAELMVLDNTERILELEERIFALENDLSRN